MRQCRAWLIGLVAWPGVAFGQAPTSLHLSYDSYAASLQVAQVDADIGLGPRDYRMRLAFHTTGMVGFFYRGHQLDMVSGSWRGLQPVPTRFVGAGVWRGSQRAAQLDYDHGVPIVRQLVPPNEAERESVPDALQANSVDSLSALAQLTHAVAATGRCETSVRTYDGRRAVEIRATTAGEEDLEPTGRSSFAGRTLRCDFVGRMVSGFKVDDDRDREAKPLHGSAWLAPVVAGGSPVPVRITFETRWFGDTTMYLTSATAAAEPNAAAPGR